VLFCASSLHAVASAEGIDRNREYNLKAAFLYGFGRYITWREESANSGDFRIGVLGESPIVEKLRKVAAKRELHGRPLTIRVAQSVDQLGECQIIFVASEVPDEEISRLFDTALPSTIVVGERAELHDRGASATFFLKGAAVRFELHHQILQEKNVIVDAKLLSLSRTRL